MVILKNIVDRQIFTQNFYSIFLPFIKGSAIKAFLHYLYYNNDIILLHYYFITDLGEQACYATIKGKKNYFLF